jgi:hypothetical protein
MLFPSRHNIFSNHSTHISRFRIGRGSWCDHDAVLVRFKT